LGRCPIINPSPDMRHWAHVCIGCRGPHPLTSCPTRNGAGTSATPDGKAESKP
jgi:hypothetical protein